MANGVRGEVSAVVGPIELTMVATMNHLAQLSAATGRPTFEELSQRLAGSEVDTTMQAVRIFTVRGVRKASDADRAANPEAKDESLDYQRAMEAVTPLLDLGTLLRLRGPMTELLGQLIKSGAPTPGDRLKNE